MEEERGIKIIGAGGIGVIGAHLIANSSITTCIQEEVKKTKKEIKKLDVDTCMWEPKDGRQKRRERRKQKRKQLT